MEEFLRRRLNPFLLISTVVVLAILAGLSVTYQDVLSDKVSTNQELRETLDDRNARISTLEAENANLTAELGLTEQDLASTINETARQEREIQGLESSVSSLEASVSSLETTVSQQEENITSLQAEVDEQSLTIDNLEANLSIICETPNENLTAEADDLCDTWWE